MTELEKIPAVPAPRQTPLSLDFFMIEVFDTRVLESFWEIDIFDTFYSTTELLLCLHQKPQDIVYSSLKNGTLPQDRSQFLAPANRSHLPPIVC
ncbi:MAG: hypothetical protein IJK06_11525 [Clostridia bacterium]|nr:hypothetical protein [Clostridia bacterium]